MKGDVLLLFTQHRECAATDEIPAPFVFVHPSSEVLRSANINRSVLETDQINMPCGCNAHASIFSKIGIANIDSPYAICGGGTNGKPRKFARLANLP